MCSSRITSIFFFYIDDKMDSVGVLRGSLGVRIDGVSKDHTGWVVVSCIQSDPQC